MSIKFEDYIIAEWFANKEQHRCGYCKNPRGSTSFGMWVESMSVEDYQDLIDRGWRRSGKYCYKPIMNETCCPQYTIRCSAPGFQLTKSQKKVLKKFNKYLIDGQLTANQNPDSAQHDDASVNDIFIRENVIMDKMLATKKVDVKAAVAAPDVKPSASKVPEIKPKVPNGKQANSAEPKTSNKAFKEGKGIDPTKPPMKKAKQLRLERKKDKLLKRGMSLEKLSSDNGQKTVEQFVDALPENTKHKLHLCLVQTSEPGHDWDLVKSTEHQLYAKYQMQVHNDPPEKVTMKTFERFLVKSPLQIELVDLFSNRDTFATEVDLYKKYQMVIHNEPLDDCDDKQFKNFLVETPLKFCSSSKGPGFGSFHQQYWIDDQLVAVGVIDILPKCVSSVYFFYDPDYRSLTLGTMGFLRELYFTRSLNLDHYYMGFYIHSCPKMIYKGKLVPSYLLCPETYKWFPIENATIKLDQNKYSRLNDDLSDKDVNLCSEQDLDKIKIFICSSHKLTNFRSYKTLYDEVDIFRNIGKLIGKQMCDRIIIVK